MSACDGHPKDHISRSSCIIKAEPEARSKGELTGLAKHGKISRNECVSS
jgi:hypothetical protein